MNYNIIYFLEGKGQNPSIYEIWSYNFFQLEYKHDYIQWLFPLKEPSKYNINAPILSDEDIQYIKSNEKLKNHILFSFKQMLHFYGFKIDDENKIEYNKNYWIRKFNWLHKNNHNFNRITRILKSLCLLGLEKYAIEWEKILEEVYLKYPFTINDSINYWRRAVMI